MGRGEGGKPNKVLIRLDNGSGAGRPELMAGREEDRGVRTGSGLQDYIGFYSNLLPDGEG